MKEVKLIEEAIRSTNEDGIRQMLEQFLRANTVVRDEKLDLSKFVCKDNQRPAITGILHEKGLKVATDGAILVAIYSHYKSEYEGKVITPKGEIIDGALLRTTVLGQPLNHCRCNRYSPKKRDK